MTLNLKSGFRNLLRLQILGLQGPLGFFEAADFDPIRTDENGMQIVRMHTSGHQGMILCAICNILQEHFIARLFSSLPRVQAYSLLLEERMIHQKLWIRHPFRRPDPAISSDEESFERQARPLHFPIDAHILSGGGTCWLIDAQGGGCILHNGQLLTCFEESCHIPNGMRIYLRDSKSGAFWVATDPYLMHSVRFEAAQAVFTHSYQQLECSLRMWVDPLDGSAVHCLELQNNTAEERIMEVCSYLEIAVDAADGDEQPAAANSSFEAERFERSGIYAVERRKSAPARRIWHLLKTDAELSMVRLQCDRAAFLGRGRSFHAPRALEYAISAVADVLGTVDDPCVSVRGQFTLAANSSVRLFLITHVAKEDEQASVFIERCSSAVNLLRSYNSAVTRAMVSAKQQRLSADEQNVLSRMTGALLYSGQPWQGGMTVLSSETLSKLHIQHERPFVLLECSGSINRSLLSLLIRGRRWFILGGFSFDLVIVLQGRRKLPALVEETEDLLHEHHAHDENGIHILKQPDAQLLSLLRTCSRLALSTTASLEDQLDSLTQNAFARPVYTARPSQQGKSTLPAADDALLFNGYGGFTPAEGHYQIMLLPGMQTPFPWQNVLQNPVMGTLTNESGLLCSFAKNEHAAFLTRHPDCAVSPRGDEAFFLQDHVNHLLWSLTRQPLGHGMPVCITHGFGETMYECSAYGIYARLQCFMDPEHPASLRIIQIKNEDQQERTLTLSHCCIFSPAAFLKCETDRITGWDPDANGMIGLFAADPSLCTCSAMSSGMFQGLWNNAPYALSCMDRSSAKSGNTAVLSFDIHLPPGESCTFTTALCYGKNAESFEHTLHLLRDQGTSERLLLMRQLWEERLNVLQFDLPDPSLTLLLNRWLPYQLWTDDDSLQNAFALLETHPNVMRKCLLSKIHANQNIDLFFLFAAASYAEVSGDESILQEEEGLFLQRCIQCIDGLSFGAHDLPKIQNKESVLAGMFLCEVLRLFAPLCSEQEAKKMETRRDALLDAVERFAWNGVWYLSGWDAESAHSAEEQGVDLTTQCWAVLCGVSRERCAIAMEQAWQQLYDHKTGLLQDFSNAEHMSSAAGCQAVVALHQLGQNERAWELALRLLPVSHSVSRQAALRYRCEPYAMAGGIHTGKGLRGRAFDPWDGSSASWYIVTILRMLLGFHKAGNQLSFRPVGLKAWENLRITYRFGRSTYHLHASRSQRLAMADGEPLPSGVLTLVDDGKIHEAFFPLR